MLFRTLLAALTLLGVSLFPPPIRGAADDPKATPKDLPGDWKTVKEIPNFDDDGKSAAADKLTVWVEQGWLIARRETKSGELEWHIVLARVTNPQQLQMQIDEIGNLSMTYGTYFVRENSGRLRALRERKDDQSLAWPLPPADPKQKTLASTGGKTGETALVASGDWCWVTSGPDKKPDVRIRLQHAELHDGSYGAQNFSGLRRVPCGRASLQDEGDLLVATRILIPAAQAELQVRKLKRELFERPAPALDGSQWLNITQDISLEQLKGKVVLLDFWGQWCAPCVKKLPLSEELHTKFKERGLVVIGVHSADQSEKLKEFLKVKKVSFPVMIDRGETAKRYVIDTWPTYFLIDKTGKVVWGFAGEPPTTTKIEELLSK
jgi:thiol-disulfide isomerase/thioredoxin